MQQVVSLSSDALAAIRRDIKLSSRKAATIARALLEPGRIDESGNVTSSVGVPTTTAHLALEIDKIFAGEGKLKGNSHPVLSHNQSAAADELKQLCDLIEKRKGAAEDAWIPGSYGIANDLYRDNQESGKALKEKLGTFIEAFSEKA